MKVPTRTSYSAIATYESCPLSYWLYYIVKMRDENKPRPAADRGTRLHLAVERYLKGEIGIEKLSIDFRHIRGDLQMMKELGAKAEDIWLVGEDWAIHEEDGDTTMVKSIVDIHYLIGNELYIYDLKTGQPYPEHAEQLQLYAVMGFSKYPEAEMVLAALLYLEGQTSPTMYKRGDVQGLRDFWTFRSKAPLEATEFPATPSRDACHWCDYRKSKGGPCEFG
jgi:hypothetical protein